MFRSKPVLPFYYLLLMIIFLILTTAESKCPKTCDLALASYNVLAGTDLSFISKVTNSSITEIMSYNPNLPNKDSPLKNHRINVPFTCDCIEGEFLGHVFPYAVRSSDTYETIAQTYYANLTTPAMLERFNGYEPDRIIPGIAVVNVTVNCSCGDGKVSGKYGLFVTYPLKVGDSLESIAGAAKLRESLLRRYNPGANFSAGSGLVYIPGRDKSGHYPCLKSCTGLTGKVIAGICLGFGGLMGALLVAVCMYRGFYHFYGKKKVQVKTSIPKTYDDTPLQVGISVGKAVEFSCEELAKATDDFSIRHMIGKGGFGSVYYAELQGEWRLGVNLAGGLEYIHEHTKRVYIHRDIKSANILIDKSFRAKVADFGLAKLAEVGGFTRLEGTFGYMPPDYAQCCGDISAKVDVYAFGVVLYELISAKKAIVESDGVESDGSTAVAKNLGSLFEEAFNKPDPRENLRKLIDPRLGHNHPFDSVLKMAELAKACTQVNPLQRPDMRSVVVALITLSSPIEATHVGSFHENQAIIVSPSDSLEHSYQIIEDFQGFVNQS